MRGWHGTTQARRSRDGLRKGIEGLAVAAAILASSHSIAQPPSSTGQSERPGDPIESSSNQQAVSPLTPANSGVYDISIRNTGSANAAAQGTEVWLQYTVGETTDFPGALFELSEGWVARDGFFVSSGSGDALNFRGELNGVAGLVFFRHPWSGQVEVVVNGMTQSIDLYSPASDSVTVPLNGDPAIPGRPVESPPQAPSVSTPITESEPSTPGVKAEETPATNDDSSVWTWAWMPILVIGILIVAGGGFLLAKRPKN